MPLLSVIIPTHNRANILEKCLTHLESQTIAEDIEVIVINDVQNDKEYERIANSAWQIPVSFETISPCHQGVARNKGVQKARSSTLLFIGDDILLAPDACALHVEAHEHADGDVATDEKAPWHFKLMIVALVIYLSWRVIAIFV